MNRIRRIAIGVACAAALTTLALTGCAGGGNDGDRIGAFGTGYGSNGTRLLERDDDGRPSAGAPEEAGRIGGPATDEVGGYGRRGAKGGFAGGVKEEGGPSAGRIEPGLSGERLRSGSRSGVPVGNGYDGITPDGKGTSDPKGAAAENSGGVALQLGGLRIADADAMTGDGARVLRVTSPAARQALSRLSRNLQSGRPWDRADEIARDLRIVLRDAR